MNEFSMKFISDFLGISEEELLKKQDREDLWSSLEWLEIVFSIEEEFDIKFDTDELSLLKTPQKLYQATIKKISSKN